MGLDLVTERAEMLGKTGSFWYRTVSEEDRSIADAMTQVGTMTRANRQLSNAARACLSGGYFQDNDVLMHFSDSDIVYNGVDKALQERYRRPHGGLQGLSRGTNLVIRKGTLASDAAGQAYGEYGRPVAFPAESDIVLPEEYRTEFGLLTDPDTCVNSIYDAGDRVMVNGTDFIAAFGYIAFFDNPVHKFPDMKFVAGSVTRRRRNLMSYTLRLNNVYGPVDRVVEYYRGIQSPHTFRMAAAQACGMAVVNGDDRVADVLPLHGWYSYITESGKRYDAPYPHLMLHAGDTLDDGQIIGGGQLFDILHTKEQIMRLQYIDAGTALPVPGVRIPNRTIRVQLLTQGLPNGYDFLPAYEGDGAIAYLDYLDARRIEWGGRSIHGLIGQLKYANGLEDFLTNRCQGKVVCLCINEEYMPKQMKLDLMGFVERELPIGSVLTLGPLAVTISPDGEDVQAG